MDKIETGTLDCSLSNFLYHFESFDNFILCFSSIELRSPDQTIRFPTSYGAFGPKCGTISAEPNSVKLFHALHKIMTMNYPPPFRNRKDLMENEMGSVLDRKGIMQIRTLRPDD
jgi:hypothetical protein